MKYLYVDNFRGFSSTLIPIKKVNFLVGENSTGKTSLLSLLNLLCSMPFWVRQEFNTDQVELGNFIDIVSLEAQDKSYFRIGFFLDQLESKKNGTKSPILILMTFTESSDIPLLTRYNYLDNETEYEIIFSESEEAIKYSRSSAAQQDYSPESLLQKINRWEKEKETKKEFKTLQGEELAGKTETLSAAAYLVGMKYARELSPTQFKFFRDFAWIAPIRSKPRRTYDRLKYDFSPEGEHAPYLIKKILSDKRSSAAFLKFIRGFGRKSSLFSSIDVNEFGMDASSPFELKVKIAETLININYVGYGVSQCLPFLVEMFSRNKGTWYAIQQPEVHLHPKAQAALGNLFYSLSISEDKNFLIETHSDYIIDRFRLNCRQAASKPAVDSQVLYFERTPTGNTVYPIEIDDRGNYSENQPETFRDFFIKEQLELLELD